MSGQIRVNTSIVVQAASRIGSINNTIRNDFTSVVTEMNSLGTHWRGQASERAMAQFNSIRGAFVNNRHTVMDNYCRFLHQQVGAGYDDTESSNVRLAEKFK